MLVASQIMLTASAHTGGAAALIKIANTQLERSSYRLVRVARN
jgi:hypothetical protein